jgi:hypothetical protein
MTGQKPERGVWIAKRLQPNSALQPTVAPGSE